MITSRFVMRDTVEESVHALAAQRREMVTDASAARTTRVQVSTLNIFSNDFSVCNSR